MSPHAVDSPMQDANAHMTTGMANGNANGGASNEVSGQPQLLRRHDDDELHDLVCIGFGPASLAIAIALYDALETGEPRLNTATPKVRFLERQDRFRWHAGMMLPGAKMQITFIKDLATLRDPRSRFTFLNYLYHKERLTAFTNLGTFLPERIEYEDYMGWCAGHFDDVVDYHQEVNAVEIGQTNPKTGAVDFFVVKSWDRNAGKFVTLKSRHVVLAVGGKPTKPPPFDLDHPSIIHSSQYATKLSEMLSNKVNLRSVAVTGSGQSAAEIFNDVPSHFPDAKTYLLIRGSALRPSDDSPFVNEIFDPDRVDDIYEREPSARKSAIQQDKATNYGVVRLELLEEIYSKLYSYRVQYGDEKNWPQRILTHRSVVATSIPSDNKSALRLHVDDSSDATKMTGSRRSETLDVDLVVVATGYDRHPGDYINQDVQKLLQDGDGPGLETRIGRDYGVKFREGAVSAEAGIWLQGCNEGTHGLSDTLLSILATRGGEMVQNIFGA